MTICYFTATGICAKVCPGDNITVSDEGVHFSDHCQVCYDWPGSWGDRLVVLRQPGF